MKARIMALFLCIIACLALAGECAGQEKTPAPVSQVGPVGSVARERAYSLDSQGNEYYVDAQGALHVIGKKVVVTDEKGNKRTYEVRGDEQPRRDASGRLYFKDKDGRTVYIDEGGPGGGIDPMPILKGTETEQRIESGKSAVYCQDHLDACRQKCQELSYSDRKVCLGNCERDKEKCDKND